MVASANDYTCLLNRFYRFFGPYTDFHVICKDHDFPKKGQSVTSSIGVIYDHHRHLFAGQWTVWSKSVIANTLHDLVLNGPFDVGHSETCACNIGETALFVTAHNRTRKFT